MALSCRALTTVFALEAVIGLLTAATILDLDAHWRGVEERAVNMWGFRGETRLVVTGRRVARGASGVHQHRAVPCSVIDQRRYAEQSVFYGL